MGIAYAISKLGAALTGAEQVRGDSYCLAAGRRNFLVDYKFVRDISHHGKSTCFSIATDPDMPSAEVVASASPQLKSNPRLFKKWRKQPGYTFKASGKMFRGAGWEAGMSDGNWDLHAGGKSFWL